MHSIVCQGQVSWPTNISSEDGTIITIYEPQPEKYTDNDITARAAVSIRRTADSEPVFGVMWFDAVLEPGNGNYVKVKSVTVTKSKFADDDKKSDSLLSINVEKNIPAMNIRLDRGRLKEILDQLKIDENSGI